MALTEREIAVWDEIADWEEKLYQYKPGHFESLYDKGLEQGFSLLPESIREQIFSKVDNWLFHMNAFVQGSQLQKEARDSILATARIFNPEISSLENVKSLSIDQLIYIADSQIARHRLYSVTQGGLSGTGDAVMLGSDLPAITLINLRLVQLIAMTYGNEVHTPFELMMTLKAFHAGMMPKRMQKHAWEEMLTEMEASDTFFYHGQDELTNTAWLEQPFRQILKAIAISMFRKKLIKGLPLVSIAIGGTANYTLTKNVSEFSHRFYQYRHLLEKKERT
ncbi:EcsC family protein [Peribacillus deserti]|uniref:ABC transporter substrate-binding protein n=1 Tax=Peribacillus deserti TaxID=673318 RepID=A0A2N5M0D5_9BACI|nr:EcsC family protein [Peribacillus deserti]PLT27834.1 ABC transporter substrate-binding protein [Peribacillus deserti]